MGSFVGSGYDKATGAHINSTNLMVLEQENPSFNIWRLIFYVDLIIIDSIDLLNCHNKYIHPSVAKLQVSKYKESCLFTVGEIVANAKAIIKK